MTSERAGRLLGTVMIGRMERPIAVNMSEPKVEYKDYKEELNEKLIAIASLFNLVCVLMDIYPHLYSTYAYMCIYTYYMHIM